MSLCCRSKSCTAVICLAKWRYCKTLCVLEILNCSRSRKAHYFKCEQTQMAWLCHQSAWALKLLVFLLSWVLHIFLSFNMYLFLSPSSDLFIWGFLKESAGGNHVPVPMVSAQDDISPLDALEVSPCSNIFCYVLNRMKRISSQVNSRVLCWLFQDIPTLSGECKEWRQKLEPPWLSGGFSPIQLMYTSLCKSVNLWQISVFFASGG